LRYIIGFVLGWTLVGMQVVMSVLVFIEGSPAGGALAILGGFWMWRFLQGQKELQKGRKEVPKGY